MAVKYWLGGDSTYPNKWAVAANWNGGIPVDGDEVYIDGRANVNSSTSKKYDITDFSGMTVPNVLRLIIKSAYDGNIGDGTNWLTLQAGATGREIEFAGSGYCYIKLGTSGHYVTRLIAKGSSGSYLKLWAVSGAYFSEIEAATGTVEIAADSRVDFVRVLDNCVLNGNKGVAANGVNTSIFQSSGVITWASNLLNADVVGGTFNWGSSDDGTLTGQRRCSGVIRVYRGATFNWQARDMDSSTSPTLTTVLKRFIVYNGGILNAAGIINRDYKKQLGAVSGDISEVWTGGQALFDNGTGNIAVLSGAKIRNRGGTIQFPASIDASW